MGIVTVAYDPSGAARHLPIEDDGEAGSAAEPLFHIGGNRHRLQRARITCLLRPDARLAAFGGDGAGGIAKDVADGEGAAAEARDVTLDDEFLTGLRRAL